MAIRDRAEHLQFAKDRALKYLDAGDWMEAFTSMGSDLSKHPQLKDHPGLKIGLQLMMIGSLSSTAEMRRFILGFQ